MIDVIQWRQATSSSFPRHLHHRSEIYCCFYIPGSSQQSQILCPSLETTVTQCTNLRVKREKVFLVSVQLRTCSITTADGRVRFNCDFTFTGLARTQGL